MARPKQVEQPIITSFSFSRKDGGWVIYKIKSQGDKVISIETSVPDTRLIAQEQFKVAVAKTLFAQD